MRCVNWLLCDVGSYGTMGKLIYPWSALVPNIRPYPFTAIVGQERMKRALILNAISSGIGGVLIRGERGTAKSTGRAGIV